MNRSLNVLPLAMVLLCFTALSGSQEIPSDSLGIVPQPGSVTAYAATLALPRRITVSASTWDERNVADFAVQFLRRRGILATVTSGAQAQLRLRLVAHDAGMASSPESYILHVARDGIAITAGGGAGLFYGLQTLEQLFPASNQNIIHFVDIQDSPQFRWRGIHLDVSRHFYSVSTVERYIDVAAHYKLNTFHWHLTDDQGWRIEIKRYPRLTTIGSCRTGTQLDKDPSRTDGKRYCGFYSQRQIRDVVAYAKRRYVKILPEVEMPGHSTAALAAYPKYACSPGPFKVSSIWGVTSEIYCPTERTFTFLANILSEVASMFPNAYVHIGGDEVPKEAWRKSTFVHALMQREHLKTYDAVQGYFERRMERALSRVGRRMVGWDEILDGGVTRTATVMSWRGDAGGIKAAKRGNDVVMSPDGPLYFDAYQGDQGDEPEAIGGLSTPEMVYDYNPVPPSLRAKQAQHVLGVQGNLWTEYIGSENYLYYMLLPRELALSEIAWSASKRKNWASFVARSGKQYGWLTAHHYNFRIPNPSFSMDSAGVRLSNVSPSVRTVSAQIAVSAVDVTISDAVPEAIIRFTTDGTIPTKSAMQYTAPLHYTLQPQGLVRITAVAQLPDGRMSTPSELILRR
jgi:hexosaminidase